MRKIFISVLFLLCFSSATFSQNRTDNFSLLLSSALNVPDEAREHVALSFSFEPRYRIFRPFTLGLRYELGFASLGKQRWIGGGTLAYRETDSALARYRSAALMGYLHANVFQAKFQLGLGLEYINTASRVRQTYSGITGQLMEVENLPSAGKIGATYGLWVDVGRTTCGIKISRQRVEPESDFSEFFVNLSVGYELFSTQSKWDFIEKGQRIPVLFLELAGQVDLPLWGPSNASALAAVFEPKIAVSENMSIGFHVEFGKQKGFGKDNDNEFLRSETGGTINWRKINRMEKTAAQLLTYDYYIPAYGGWYFLGGGIGMYKQMEFAPVPGISLDGSSEYSLPHINEKNSPGIMFRAGMKTSLVRFGLNINFAGEDISNYIGFQVGFEPSFLKNEN